jgi:signal transduction histidine kinase
MSQLAASQASNRRALLIFIAVLSAVVIAAAAAVLLLQRQYLLSNEQEELRVEMILIGELATDALLRSDYATVEGLLQRWIDRHTHITEIRAVMPNGFVLAEVHKLRSIEHPFSISQPVSFNGRTLLTLHATHDVSAIDSGFASIIINITSLSVLFILLLGWLLWVTLKRTALAPLEAQILSRNEKENELLQRTAELEGALKELETFSYSVSHDLRAPLRAIDGFSRVVLEDHGELLNDEGRGYLQRVVAAAHRMGELIDDLLALSKVSRRELNITEVNLSALANDIVTELQDQSPQRQVKIEIAPDLTAKGDAQFLRVVLDNLLGNAWKYTGKKPAAHIEFACTKQGNNPPLFCVRDNGAGFDMQYADKLFQPFQRLHAPEEFPGSGIGLATVARIIARHGGRIWAEGQTGLGTIVCFTLAPATTHNHPAQNTPKASDNQL